MMGSRFGNLLGMGEVSVLLDMSAFYSQSSWQILYLND